MTNKYILITFFAFSISFTSCSKDEDPEPCGCTVTLSMTGEPSQSIDLSNADTGLIGCGTRADQAEFRLDVINELGGDFDAADIAALNFAYSPFTCD